MRGERDVATPGGLLLPRLLPLLVLVLGVLVRVVPRLADGGERLHTRWALGDKTRKLVARAVRARG